METRVVDRKTAKSILKIEYYSLPVFAFLDKTPKPSDEEVRSEFQRREFEWKLYCLTNALSVQTSLMFNAKVSYEWERKYARKK